MKRLGQCSFASLGRRTASAAGHPAAFGAAVAVVTAWAVTGPLFEYSDSWQLVINTGTTIVTFLMVFLIQSSQNRDGEAVQAKLDELIRALRGAHNALIGLEELDDDERSHIRMQLAQIAAAARAGIDRGRTDTDVGDLKL